MASKLAQVLEPPVANSNMTSGNSNFQLLSAHFSASEMMQNGVMFLDQQGNILHVNTAFIQGLGYTKEQFNPNTIFQVNPHFNLLSWRKLWAELEEQGEISIETEHVNAIGDTVPAKLRGIFTKVGDMALCTAVVEGSLTESSDELFLSQFSLENAGDMIYWLDADGRFFYANQSTCKKLGYSREELLRINVLNVEPNLTEAQWRQAWDKLKAAHQVTVQVLRRNKNGEVFPVRISQTYVNYQGREYNLSIAKDLRLEEEWLEIFDLAFHTIEQSKDMIFWSRPDGSIYFSNGNFSIASGYSREEIQQMKVLDFYSPFLEASYEEGWKLLMNEGNIHSETAITCKDGTSLPVMSNISLVHFGGKTLACTILKNLTDEKAQTEVIELAFSTMAQARDIIYWLRPDSSFFYFNNAFSKVTGYSAEEINQMNLLDFFPAFTLEEFEQGWEQLRAGGSLSSELFLTCKNSTTIPVSTLVSMVKHGELEYSCTILRDLSYRKEKELERQKLVEEIELLNHKLSQENVLLKAEIRTESDFPNIISKSASYRKILHQVEQVADTDATVLILGETGTGKELLAKALHQFSDRSDQPMVKINCGALPENLIESELFGHEKGAFTGAIQRKIGRFELAHKGTLFLDEIGELPLELQVKLLRVLQEGEFERLGGNQTIKVDVRLIAATNRKLEEEVANNRFREDLYYRLNVFPIFNIPLRERKDDIPLLVNYFVERFNQRTGRRITEIPQYALDDLMTYEFPGNVRELENIVERAAIVSKGGILALNQAFRKPIAKKESGGFKTMEDMERLHILDALRRANGKVSGKGGAAALLNMNDKTLNSRMAKLRIGRHDFLK